MRVFAIRHKPSGVFMPNKMFRTSYKGFSHWEPLDNRAHDKTPRLFYSAMAAKVSLRHWLRGKVSNSDPFEEESEPVLTPVASRNRDDMEIVEGEIKWNL